MNAWCMLHDNDHHKEKKQVMPWVYYSAS